MQKNSGFACPFYLFSVMYPIGLYIHIPFCKSRCLYCDFYSTVGSGLQARYVDALVRELMMRKPDMEGHRLKTIYLGGGTPSLLSMELLGKLFYNIYNVYGAFLDDDMEVTIECNPDDVTETYAEGLRRLPVNRVSMGAQTFDDARLRFVRRRHKSTDVARAVRRLRQAGIGNISLDLMFGFPDETLADVRTDIDALLSLDVEHVSAYSLMYEEGTPLTRMMERGEVSPIDDELSRQMYALLSESLAAAGYEHYEISNWARPGFHSRHNSSYWHDVPYIGIGAAAHSYDQATRSWNDADLSGYIDAIEAGRRPFGQEAIDGKTRYNDLITTALRTKDGIEVDSLQEPFRSFLVRSAAPAISRKLLALDGGRLHLTREGIFVSDSVFADLIYL